MAVFQSHELQVIRCRSRYMIRPKVEKFDPDQQSEVCNMTMILIGVSCFLFLFLFSALVLVQTMLK